MAQHLHDILFEGAGGAPMNPPNHPGGGGGGEHGGGADGISPAALTQRSLIRLNDRQHLTWSRVAPPGSVVPPRRSGAASVVVKGKLYMFGVS